MDTRAAHLKTDMEELGCDFYAFLHTKCTVQLA